MQSKRSEVYTFNVPRTEFRGHVGPINSCAVVRRSSDEGSDESVLASASDDKCLKIWDLENGKQLKAFVGNKHPIKFVVATVEDTVAYGCGSLVFELNIKTGERRTAGRHLTGTGICAAFDSVNKCLFVGFSDNIVNLYHEGELVTTLLAHSDAVCDLLLHKGSLYSCGADQCIVRWGKVKLDGKTLRGDVMYQGFHGAITALAGYEDVIFIGEGEQVRVYNLAEDRLDKALRKVHTSPVSCLLCDTLFLFSGALDGIVVAWQPRTKYPLVCVTSELGPTTALTVHESMLFQASCDGSGRTVVVDQWDLHHIFSEANRLRQAAKEDKSAAADSSGLQYAKLPEFNPKNSVLFQMRAKYDFKSQDQSGFEMKKGDVLDVVEDDPGNGWVCVLRDGKFSYVPSGYLQMFKAEPSPKITSAGEDGDGSKPKLCQRCERGKVAAYVGGKGEYKWVCRSCVSAVRVENAAQAHAAATAAVSDSADASEKRARTFSTYAMAEEIIMSGQLKLRTYKLQGEEEASFWKKEKKGLGLMNRARSVFAELDPVFLHLYHSKKKEKGERYSIFHADVMKIEDPKSKKFEITLLERKVPLKLELELDPGSRSNSPKVSKRSSNGSGVVEEEEETLEEWITLLEHASAQMEERLQADVVDRAKDLAPHLQWPDEVALFVHGSISHVDFRSSTSRVRMSTLEPLFAIAAAGSVLRASDVDAAQRREAEAIESNARAKLKEMQDVQQSACDYLIGKIVDRGSDAPIVRVSKTVVDFGGGINKCSQKLTDSFSIRNGGSGELRCSLIAHGSDGVTPMLEPSELVVQTGSEASVTVSVFIDCTKIYADVIEIRLQDGVCSILVPLLVQTEKSTKLSFSELEFGETLGGGTFGTVMKGTYRGAPVAIKVMANEDDYYREDEILQKLTETHPNIVRFHGSCVRTPFQGVIVFDYCPLGSLDALIFENVAGVPPELCLRICKDVANALTFLHAKNLLHLDMKPANVLLVSLDPTTKGAVAQLCDFGISYQLDSEGTVRGQEVGGTISYMAPEMLKDRMHSPKCDIYSFGITLWEMITRKHAYTGEEFDQYKSPWKFAEMKEKGTLPGAMPKEHPLCEILEQCLLMDRRQRPTSNELAEKLAKVSVSLPQPVALSDRAVKIQRSRAAARQSVAVALGGMVVDEATTVEFRDGDAGAGSGVYARLPNPSKNIYEQMTSRLAGFSNEPIPDMSKPANSNEYASVPSGIQRAQSSFGGSESPYSVVPQHLVKGVPTPYNQLPSARKVGYDPITQVKGSGGGGGYQAMPGQPPPPRRAGIRLDETIVSDMSVDSSNQTIPSPKKRTYDAFPNLQSTPKIGTFEVPKPVPAPVVDPSEVFNQKPSKPAPVPTKPKVVTPELPASTLQSPSSDPYGSVPSTDLQEMESPLKLRKPTENDWVGQKWYNANASRKDAEQLLKGKPGGTFLLRPSTRSGCLSISHVEKNGNVGHGLLHVWKSDDRAGYSIEDSGKTFERLEHLLAHMGSNIRLSDYPETKFEDVGPLENVVAEPGKQTLLLKGLKLGK